MVAVSTPYGPTHPPADLAGTLVCSWDATFCGVVHMVPDGCMELMWLDGAGVLICGPETTMWSAFHPVEVDGCGVRIRPGVGPQLFGVPARVLADHRVPAAELLGASRADELEERIANAPAGVRSHVLLDEVRRLRSRSRATIEPLFPAMRLVERNGGVAGLADALGVTTRTVHRASERSFGYGPATLRSIVRLQRMLAWHKADPALTPAELAAVAGYADQSHLGREVRARSGMTPTQLFASPCADWHGSGHVVAVG